MKDLNKVGCHGYQFQVWRYSGQSRRLIEALCTWTFVAFVHWKIIRHMAFANYIKANESAIDRAILVYENPFALDVNMSDDELALQKEYAAYWTTQLYNFEWSGMGFVLVFYL